MKSNDIDFAATELQDLVQQFLTPLEKAGVLNADLTF